jgi:pimeloyl-ACP methyl ester carboxylesterase
MFRLLFCYKKSGKYKMEYTSTYKELKNLFTAEKDFLDLPGTGICIHNLSFTSHFPDNNFLNESDPLISENRSFTYPVFSPSKGSSGNVILLLHGLNERSWVKYLVWAFSLAEKTGSHVILFPISFHINRSPDSWRDPRKMVGVMNKRLMSMDNIMMSSFANAALSNRLTEYPFRFFNSGYQTAADIISLLKSIRDGLHPLIPGGSNINIFAYSIGAFLAEIMLMANPDNLLSDSRLFIFCGGSVFSTMRGSSKLIMDSLAFDIVYSYYMNDFEKSLKGKGPVIDFLKSSSLGMAFRSMIDFGRFRKLRENFLNKLHDRIHSITLKSDMVIPAEGVLATLNTAKRRSAEVWDFRYNYSHENPFPVFTTPLCEEVNRSFESIFSRAAAFLCCQ